MKNWRIGITLRTALLSWLVSLATLMIFVAVILPLQKRIFLENLESKARGVAASLRDITAGAAINEDYSSVIEHCREMLQADDSLAYLVITKSDGFSLVQNRSGWRTSTASTSEWRPERRVPLSEIRPSSLGPERVFHFSQPFDYSGIEWGWLHVGLSLKDYNRSVATLYQRTGLLAIICVVVSMLGSTVYARWLVGPILDLRRTVQRVAGGDLSVRASIQLSDELGSLAGSVNAMTEALLRRDQILATVQFAAQQFLSTADWLAALKSVLARLGDAAGVNRVEVFEVNGAPPDVMELHPRAAWFAPAIAGDLAPPPRSALHGAIEPGAPFYGWLEPLSRNEIVTALLRNGPATERALLEQAGIQSIIVVPIRVDGLWWGSLALCDGVHERAWSSAERDSFRAAADMLGAAIARQRVQDALVEAKKNLEQRVEDRTHELREQVEARARAHAALAEAQHQLVAASRQAGMAEVATGVLHNVGNVLNSINVSATVAQERLQRSEVTTLVRAMSLLREHAADLPAYLTTDPKGRSWPSFVQQLAEQLARERDELLAEHNQLARGVDHIKEIVAMQQSYAQVSGLTERLSVAQLVDDALQMNVAGLSRHGIHVERHYEPVPDVVVDKHKVLQILVNLVHNAKYAMDVPEVTRRVLRIEIALAGPQQVRIVVRDTGVGIPPENLTRIFSHGFTTRKGGHGFGLHSGANAAREMGGQLTAASAGAGHGAAFTLLLPISLESPAS
ncbi:ATP-binding protein [Opitutus terrae]|uniref:histidine kinase n=1 Tax=Opitutus terrae (strain DSM 11246 / JCM 15787 / PB90-1) TaxID=452637 RepID=B2A071_OPITP|nr:ATP-binding protein [Opitutus terrae]ACB77407.1 multi-sensor signal transduction histidine kinase [Opitutus terrae PB90-1]